MRFSCVSTQSYKVVESNPFGLFPFILMSSEFMYEVFLKKVSCSGRGT